MDSGSLDDFITVLNKEEGLSVSFNNSASSYSFAIVSEENINLTVLFDDTFTGSTIQREIMSANKTPLQTVSKVGGKVYLAAYGGITVIDEINKTSERIPLNDDINDNENIDVYSSSDTVYMKRKGSFSKLDIESNTISSIDLPNGFLEFSKIIVSQDNVISISGGKSDGSFGIGEFDAEGEFTEIENESKEEVIVIQRIN